MILVDTALGLALGIIPRQGRYRHMHHEATPPPTLGGTANDTAAHAFITRWRGSTASELSTAQSFVIDLCALLGVDKPHPTPAQDYMFERPVTFRHGDGSSSAGRIDCYRQGAFCLESKKLKAAGHTKDVAGNKIPNFPRRTRARCFVASRLCGLATRRALRLASHPDSSG